MSIAVHVLGTAQDGGFPHAGCPCERCAAALADPRMRRRVASIAVVGKTGRTLLVDATPDFVLQTAALAEATGRTPPAFDGIFLTHAHMGHYVGLSYLGREAMHADKVSVTCTRQMERFLATNRPWSHLVERNEIAIRLVAPGESQTFDGVRLDAFLSPHRGEDTDTLGIEVKGPSKTLVYVSDADVFPPGLVARILEADVALVDGTFFSREELPHRDILDVRHPYVKDSLRLFAKARGEIHFTHLNHTNPLLDADPARRPALPPRFFVAREGQTFTL
jgi:pyrroloquinoline quinone biosynthesis protein B